MAVVFIQDLYDVAEVDRYLAKGMWYPARLILQQIIEQQQNQIEHQQSEIEQLKSSAKEKSTQTEVIIEQLMTRLNEIEAALKN